MTRIVAAQTLRFETTPSPPFADQPFTAQIYLPILANSASEGFVSDIIVNGHAITTQFEFHCGFLCPGGPIVYGPFPLKMPALHSGQYTLTVTGATSPPLDLGTVNFAVGGPAPLPIGDPRLLFTLCLLVAGIGCVAIRQTGKPSTLRHGNFYG